MKIETVSHKALRRFLETGTPKGLDASVAERLIKMVAFLFQCGSVEELKVPPTMALTS